MRQLLMCVFLVVSMRAGVLEAQNISMQISQVTVNDEGEIADNASQAPFIDTTQDACGDEADAEAEPFFDTILALKVKNTSSVSLNPQRFRYRLRDENGAAFLSRALSPTTSGSEILPDSEGQVNVLFAKALGGRKYFHEASAPISANLGFRNVTLTLRARDSRGRVSVARKRLAFSFGNYDRCQ